MTTTTLGQDGFYHPRDEGEIVDLIRRAREEGKTLRVRGAAHSVHAAIFTDSYNEHVPDPSGLNILLDQLRHVDIDKETRLVTVQAGCNLGRDPMDPSGTSTEKNSLFYQITEAGLAFPDTGGIIHQTVAGFLGTGSTGGSLQHTIGDTIVAIRFIDGRGNIHEVSEAAGRDQFLAAGVSVGLLGVVTAVTFQCVDTFDVIGQESITTEEDCAIDLFGDGTADRPSLEQFLRQTEHTRLIWWPQKGVRRVVVWQGRRMKPADYDDETAPGGTFKPRPYNEFFTIFGSMLPAQLLGAAFFVSIRWWNASGILGGLTRLVLKLILAPVIKLFVSLDGKKGPQRFWADWWHTLPMDDHASDRLLPTEFTELWIPVERTAEVMQRLRSHYTGGGLAATGTYACDIYATTKSRFWMSPAYERDVIKIDMFWYGYNHGDPAQTYYPQFWELLKDFDYRLHWGKYLSHDSAAYLKPLYPKWDDFMRIREELDPDQVFVNAYWRKHLGIPLKCES